MLRIVLIQPGSTDFDDQGRITGTLDLPLSQNGTLQVARTIDELAAMPMAAVYAAPCQSCQQTADALAQPRKLKVRRLDSLRNLDLGLWHGKRIDEMRQHQPRIYRQWQEHPETVCPPQGESLAEAQRRVTAVVKKLFRKHKEGVIALVAPEPVASLVRQALKRSALGDLWKAECESARWEAIDVEPQVLAIP
jgi:probable phosphoglycerate mutase